MPPRRSFRACGAFYWPLTLPGRRILLRRQKDSMAAGHVIPWKGVFRDLFTGLVAARDCGVPEQGSEIQ